MLRVGLISRRPNRLVDLGENRVDPRGVHLIAALVKPCYGTGRIGLDDQFQLGAQKLVDLHGREQPGESDCPECSSRDPEAHAEG